MSISICGTTRLSDDRWGFKTTSEICCKFKKRVLKNKSKFQMASGECRFSRCSAPAVRFSRQVNLQTEEMGNIYPPRFIGFNVQLPHRSSDVPAIA
jgi:hypothetical protein